LERWPVPKFFALICSQGTRLRGRRNFPYNPLILHLVGSS